MRKIAIKNLILLLFSILIISCLEDRNSGTGKNGILIEDSTSYSSSNTSKCNFPYDCRHDLEFECCKKYNCAGILVNENECKNIDDSSDVTINADSYETKCNFPYDCRHDPEFECCKKYNCAGILVNENECIDE